MIDHNIDYANLVSLRCDFPDLYADLAQICNEATYTWGKAPINRHWNGFLDETINLLSSKATCPPTKATRMYLTTEFFAPCLVVSDLNARTIETIKDFTSVYFASGAGDLSSLHENCFMLWLFEGDALKIACPVTSTIAAELLTAFAPENLVSRARLRPHWYLPEC